MFLQDIPTPRIKDDFFEKPTLKYEKHKGAQEEYLRSKMEENNALKNWQLKMIERKRQQGYISSETFLSLFTTYYYVQ